MGRIRYRQLLFLIALILPTVAIAFLGWKDLKSESDNVGVTQKKVAEAIIEALLNKLEGIKVGELASSPASTGKHSDPAVIFAGSVNQIEQLEQAVGVEIDLPSQALSERAWKPIGKEAWLSMTPPTGVSRQPLLIAVRGKDIVKRVSDDRIANGNEIPFEIVSDEIADLNSNAGSTEPEDPIPSELIAPSVIPSQGGKWDKSSLQSLGDRFPGLVVHFLPDQAARRTVAVHQMFYAMSLAFFLSGTLVGWYLMLRDTRNEVRIAEMRSQREVRIAEMRSRFVANVSHELRTPLTSILLFAETLRMRGVMDPQFLAEHLDTIINESERLTRLLNNVLNFSKIERGQKDYRMNPTPLGDVVQSVARTMQIPLLEQGFHLNVDICDNPPSMRVDRDALEQAVLNLLTNAMKYSGNSREIAMRLKSSNGSALIQVEDHGIGVAPEEQKRIFEEFYRVESPESRAVSGVGIGLALVAHIAAGHGGSIDVESRLGEGSTFTIRIPINGNGNS